jgi:hypothetical protein
VFVYRLTEPIDLFDGLTPLPQWLRHASPDATCWAMQALLAVADAEDRTATAQSQNQGHGPATPPALSASRSLGQQTDPTSVEPARLPGSRRLTAPRSAPTATSRRAAVPLVRPAPTRQELRINDLTRSTRRGLGGGAGAPRGAGSGVERVLKHHYGVS